MKFTEISDRVYSNQPIDSALPASCHTRGISFQMEVPLPVSYKEVLLDCGYRIDLLVSGDLIVEIKCVETLLPIHHAQILTYMRLAKIPTGLLINFNVTTLKNGIKRFVL